MYPWLYRIVVWCIDRSKLVGGFSPPIWKICSWNWIISFPGIRVKTPQSWRNHCSPIYGSSPRRSTLVFFIVAAWWYCWWRKKSGYCNQLIDRWLKYHYLHGVLDTSQVVVSRISEPSNQHCWSFIIFFLETSMMFEFQAISSNKKKSKTSGEKGTAKIEILVKNTHKRLPKVLKSSTEWWKHIKVIKATLAMFLRFLQENDHRSLSALPNHSQVPKSEIRYQSRDLNSSPIRSLTTPSTNLA